MTTLMPEFRDQIHHAAREHASQPRHAFRRGRLLPRPTWRVLRHAPVALSLLIAVAIAAGAIAALGRHSPARRPHEAVPAATTKPAWLSELASHYAVLNTRPNPMPTAVARALATTGVPADGLRFAHRVIFPGGTVWIIPEPSGLCLALGLPGVQRPAGLTCSPGKDGVRLSEGQREHLGQPPGPNNPFRALKAGIVRDDVTAVRVYPPDRPPITGTVKDNAFLVATTPSTPVRLVR